MHSREEEDEKPKAQASKEDETESNDNVLRSLFEMTGVHSALEHDRIMDSGQQDEVFTKREGKPSVCGRRGMDPTNYGIAQRIAQMAKETLHQSRKERRRMPVNIPTWTGRSGTIVMPRRSESPQPRFGRVTTYGVSSPAGSGGGSPKQARFGSGAVSGFAGSAASKKDTPSTSSLLSAMWNKKTSNT